MRKMRKHPIIYSVLILAAAALLAVAVLRIDTLSRTYPSPVFVEHAVGEKVVGGDLGLTVSSVRVFCGSKIDELLPGYVGSVAETFGSSVGADDIKMVIVEMEVCNSGERDAHFDFRPLVLQTGAWNNSVNLEAYNKLNSQDGADPSIVKGDSSRVVQLPYAMYSLQFRNLQDWQNIETREYEVVLSTYPVCHTVRLDAIELVM